MHPYEILRLEGANLQPRQAAWCSYVESLGADPKRASDRVVIMQDDDGYHLHLSIKTRHPSGKGDWLDLARGTVVTTPLVIDLGHEPNWPGGQNQGR